MNVFFAVIIIGFVVLMVLFNVYFRYKILGDYRYLIKNKIDFGINHIVNSTKLEAEVIPRYPKHADKIRSFCKKITVSFKIAIGLLVLVIVVALIFKSYIN